MTDLIGPIKANLVVSKCELIDIKANWAAILHDLDDQIDLGLNIMVMHKSNFFNVNYYKKINKYYFKKSIILKSDNFHEKKRVAF